MDATLVWVFLAPVLAGMITMIICGAIAKQWLSANTGYQPSRVAAFFLGPLLTSFGPVRDYTEVRRQRNLPTTLATVFWIATAFWGLGLLAFFGWLFASVR